jgi:glycerol-3-phosphate dehydrogenase (NAD(P)+)
MKKVAVLGAGYMGSAITFPLSDNGYDINLWGTWLDDEIIKSCKNGYHPKLKKKMPDGVEFFYSKDLKAAVSDVDIIFMGITSNGFINVFKKLIDIIDKNYIFFKLTKGLADDNGNIKRIAQAAEEIFKSKFSHKEFNWTVIGGPVKAGELSNKIPTASIYAPNNKKVVDLCYSFSTEYYPITITDDAIGVEISSAFKNVYAIVIGICDGLYRVFGEGNYHNFNSFVFNQGMLEISIMAEKAGGRRSTVFDLAGIGDFYVASLSGRNRRYGEEIGKGGGPNHTFKKMFEEGEVAEGYMALEIAIDWVNSLDKDLIKQLPLLKVLHEIIFEGKDAKSALDGFVQVMRKRFKNQEVF